MIKNSPICPILNIYQSEKCYNLSKTLNQIDKYLLTSKKAAGAYEMLNVMKNDDKE